MMDYTPDIINEVKKLSDRKEVLALGLPLSTKLRLVQDFDRITKLELLEVLGKTVSSDPEDIDNLAYCNIEPLANKISSLKAEHRRDSTELSSNGVLISKVSELDEEGDLKYTYKTKEGTKEINAASALVELWMADSKYPEGLLTTKMVQSMYNKAIKGLL